MRHGNGGGLRRRKDVWDVIVEAIVEAIAGTIVMLS